MLYDDDIGYIPEADRNVEEDIIPSFSAYSVTVSMEGDFDEKKALELALAKAKSAGVAVRSPYYVVYLLSSGDWEHSVRYYEVLLTADET